jgi:hypothetical protein
MKRKTAQRHKLNSFRVILRKKSVDEKSLKKKNFFNNLLGLLFFSLKNYIFLYILRTNIEINAFFCFKKCVYRFFAK